MYLTRPCSRCLLKRVFKSRNFVTKRDEDPPVPVIPQKDAKEIQKRDRQFYLKILETQPSQREARSFLKRFEPLDSSNTRDSQTIPKNNLALVALQQRLERSDLETFALSLVQLQRLGLLPVVLILDPGMANVEKRHVFQEAALKEAVRVANMIDRHSGRAMPFYDGVFQMDERLKVDLTPLHLGLELRQIPILIPLAHTPTALIPIPPKQAMVELASAFLNDGLTGRPEKVIFINNHGGWLKKGTPLPFVNLDDEYQGLISQWAKNGSQGGQIVELETIRALLQLLPTSASAIVASAKTSPAIISNFITDKPMFSASLPTPRQVVVGNMEIESSFMPTVVRLGLKVTVHTSLDTLDLQKLEDLLNASFGKKLLSEVYWERIRKVLDMVILAGDYHGASIMTREPWPGTMGLIYLDKFAAHPKSQGTGVADILWQRMLVEYRDFFWRSRSANPVNKWYFDRASGSMKLPPDGYWTAFWHGPNGRENLKAYLETCANTPASFASPQK